MPEKLELIVQNYLNGELNDKELSHLIEAFSDDEIKQQFEQSVELDYLLSIEYTKIDSKMAYLDFLSEIRFKIKKDKVVAQRKGVEILKYAALFIGIIGLGYYLATEQTEISPMTPILEIESEVITLQLSNGKIKEINVDNNIQVVDKKGNIVAAQLGNKIVYNENSISEELIYNVLHIPYGKKFEVKLSDGTIVHLNSGSSLKYPVSFLEGKDRQVFVKGEAYFKVTEDKSHPFIVSIDQMNVRVLGTEFNVSSYADDDYMNTVLVSGKVQIYDASISYEPDTSLELDPGRIATWNKVQNGFTVKKVNTDIYTGWIDGKLIFRDMPFKTIRKKLERHYNVTIINNNKSLNENTFNANFDTESIEEVLETFDRNFGIKYKIIDNQIIIHQPKKEG